MKAKEKARAEMKKALPLIVKLLDDPKFTQLIHDAGYQVDVPKVLKFFAEASGFTLPQVISSYAEGQRVGNAWTRKHVQDFVKCEGNALIIGNWLKANKLEMSIENLEKAFSAVKSKLKTFRKVVYDAIDGERAYQDYRWPGHKHSNTEFLVYIQHYVNEAFKAASTTDEYGDAERDALRKIAALAVAAMEENGVKPRVIP